MYAYQRWGVRYADDSYASYKSKVAPREVGKYNRTVSDSSVLRAQQDSKLRSSDLNNITETPNKPPRKKLELGRNSPDLGQRSNSPNMTGGENHKPSHQVPSFKAAEISPVPHAQKLVAKPLQSVTVQKLNSPATSGSAGSFISTVVQRPMPSNQSGPTVPEDQRPSVKDFVKNIEVYTHSPVLNKAGSQSRDSPVTDRKPAFPSDNTTPREQGTSQAVMDSLEKLESSVKSSDSFRDRLRPVVRKIESERVEEPPISSSRRSDRVEEPSHPSSRRSRDRRSNDGVDRVVGLPPEVPSRTYKDINYSGEQRSGRELPYRSNSFQSHNSGVHHPRPYDRSKNSSSGYSPVDMNNYKNRPGKEPQRSPSQSVPEPQVPVRGHNQSYPQRHSHDIPDKYSDKQNLDQNAKNPSPEHRVSRSSPDHKIGHSSPDHRVRRASPDTRVRHSSDKNENYQVHTQNSVPVAQKRKNDNSFVNQGKSQTISTDSQVKDVHSAEKNIQNAYTPQSCSFPNTQSDNNNKGDNSLTSDKESDKYSDVNRTRLPQSEKSPVAITSYHSGDFRNWKNEKSSYGNSNVDNQNSRSEVIQNNRSNSQTDLNKMAERAENVQTVEIFHNRQASAEELECDKKAQELAQVLKESDKELSSVLTTDSRKVRMRFMDGILPIEGADDDQKRRPRSQSDVKEERKEEKKEEPTSPMPSEYYVSPPKAMIELEIRKFGDTSQLTQDIGDNYTLAQKKEELLQRMIRKVDILKEDRKELLSDIDENESLGKQVLSLVEEKCRSQQEKDKYKSYIEDIDKIIRLLLKLSGLLARAENTIQGLTEGTNEKIRKMTFDKRDRLHKQHEDAKELKIDIDRRREQVETFLKEAFGVTEMDDYHYYIKMKSKYIIQMQELEDKITLGNEQIGALQKSIPNQS